VGSLARALVHRGRMEQELDVDVDGGGRTVRLGGSVLGRHQLDLVGGTECPPLISLNDRTTTASVGMTYH
jgi:hypothetical protein